MADREKSRFGRLWVAFLAALGVAVIALIGFRIFEIQRVSDTVDNFGQATSQAISRPFFQLGDVDISPLFLLKIILFLVILFVVARSVDRLLRTRVLTRTAMDSGQRYAASRFASYTVFAIGLIVGLQTFGVNLSTLTVFGGALGIGIGLGLQDLTNNFVSGLILLAERPIKVGDRVEVDGLAGDVIRIGARATWVRTNDNVIMIIPNSDFTEQRVINWTAHERLVRFAVPVGVSYSSNPAEVKELLMEAAVEHPDVLETPIPDVIFLGFGESSLDFELLVWTATRVQTPRILRSELYFRIFATFREHNIEIPFPQRDLHLRSSDVPISPHEHKSAES